MILIPPADPGRIQFETELIEQAGPASRTGQRLGNRISFGEPRVHDLAELCREGVVAAALEWRREGGAHEFWLLRLVCTLHPCADAKVDWFEVHIALREARPGGLAGIDTSDPADPPLVHDLYPSAVADTVQVEHTARIAPSLKFMEVTASPGEDSLALRYRQLEPRITAFGRLEPEAYWRFTPGAGTSVAEGIKEMDLIVRRRRGTRVAATVRVEGRGRRWGVFPRPPQPDDQRFEF